MNNHYNPSVEWARKRGFKVAVKHFRPYVKSLESKKVEYRPASRHNTRASDGAILCARGGFTIVEVTTPDKNITVSGHSFCHKLDQFNYKTGSRQAFFRAMTALSAAIVDKMQQAANISDG